MSRLDAWLEGEWRAWGVRLSESEHKTWRAVLERGSLLATEEAGRMVAGLAHVPASLTVPGSEVPTSILASAWVEPTRRGRGLLRGLVREYLDDLHADGVAVAVLQPAESGIYRAFGYGMGVEVVTARLPARAGGFSGEGALELVRWPEGRAAMAAIYERARSAFPGMLARDAAWWDYSYHRAAELPIFIAIHKDGFAAYSVEQRWRDGSPEDLVTVHELIAGTPEAYAALWRHCLDLALAGRVIAYCRPLEEPLLHLLADPRRLRRRPVDGLHVRLVDVGAALAARRYGAGDGVVLEVEDEFCGWNRGRFRVEAGGSAPTRGPADLALDAGALGAAYLGGISLDSLWRAGRVRECRPGGVKRADMLFAWSPRPWLSWSY
ncbi:MAG: GNAT family N-acetyltransferase [Chloroflexi bacterium]|nr:MAG: GNAT family N-acetyltransferase [Chloroflexota bacterium]